MGFLKEILSYKSVKFIQVYSPTLGIIHYATILFILMYVILVTIVWERGYQSSTGLLGTVSIKVKGSAQGVLPDGTVHIFDSSDLVLPHVEQSAVFVATSMTITSDQKRGVCGHPKVPCSSTKCDDCCKQNEGKMVDQGQYTGKCIEMTGEDGHPINVCEMRTWCPSERDWESRRVFFDGVENWTVFGKVNAYFPELDGKVSDATLSNAKNAITHGFNLFSIKEMLEEAGTPFDRQVALEGAVLLVTVRYDCDFDRELDTSEKPYTSGREPGNCAPNDDTARVSPGFNYRAINSHGINDRSLKKLYGVRIIFQVEGIGRVFDFVELTTALGAGVALLGVASLLCDFLLEHVLPHKHIYEDAKYDDVTIPEGTWLDRLEAEHAEKRRQLEESQENAPSQAEQENPDAPLLG
ncbi:MAG: hypothetical protein MHM6MM_003045 [Cercozoa sp. M6MM]